MSVVINHEMVYMPDWNFPVRIIRRQTGSKSMGCEFHWHEQIEFYLVKRGGLLLLCDGVKHWVYGGHVAVVNCCYPHKSINFMDDTLHYCIQVDLSILSSGAGDICDGFIRELAQNHVVFTGFIGKDEEIASLLGQIADEYENMSKGYELAIKACLYGIFTKLYRVYAEETPDSRTAVSHKKELQLVARLLSYIAENYTTRISLDCLAGSIGVSVSHMCRIFKKNTGSSIIEYINQLRCHRARLMLVNGCNVANAAFAAGFSDSNYFSRVFKQVFGIAPSKYQ